MAPPGILEALVAETHAAGQSLVAWGVAWARVLPTVLIVPAFGLAVLPASLRVAMGFALAVAVAPALHAPVLRAGAPWIVAALGEVVRGLPVALAASVSLFTATVAGGVADTALGVPRTSGRDTPFGRGLGPVATLVGLAAAIVFLDGGGASFVVARLSAPPPDTAQALPRAVFDLAAGVGIGASIGVPLLIVGVVLDVVTLVAARELPTLRVPTTLAPLRTLAVLVATAALLDRMVEAVVVVAR